MRRVPIVATILVGLAIALMTGLGVWQLQRRGEKAALLRQLARNERLPPIAFPRIPIGDELLFRRAGALCLEPVAWRIEGGRNAAGGVGWRRIAECRTGAEGPGFAVQMGLSSDPNGRPAWRGGRVNGYITHAVDHRPIIANLFSPQPATLMLISDTPLAGLTANPPPNLDAVPNNHLAYAVQWFLFAGIAAIIYAIALWRRAAPAARRKLPGERQDG